ncbi:MAG: glycine oxidase ThiO [Deltaproteobacteria bacterium]|nr:MAG: glycine oxidase ThiO [Deltaproteobacteria bacterium]
MTWDLIVVGAGIVGLASAFEAASSGLRVLVLERSRVAAGASRVAAGMLAPPAEAQDMPEDVLRAGIESAASYPSFIRRIEAHGLATGFRARGTLMVAADRDQAADLEQLARAHERMGLSVRWHSVREILRAEPRLSPRLAGGLFLPDAHAVEPVALCQALAHAVVELGGEVRQGWEVTEILGQEVVKGVGCHGTELWAPRVLVAGGLRSAALVRAFEPLPLRPVKGQVLHLRGESLIERVVRSPRVYLVPHRDRLIVGASEEELGEHDQPLAGVTMDLLYEAWRLLPGTYELELEACVVGHRPCLRDGRPRISRLGPPGLLVATGHHRHGILLAPWTGQRVLELLQG